MVVLLFVAALLLIVIAAELFTNAVEWAGFRLRLGSGATGSLLAAIGTALPETTVPIVALIGGSAGAVRIATGAVIGAPLLLLTLGAGFTGLAVMLRRHRPVIELTTAQVRRDLGVFLIAFSALAVCLVLPPLARHIIGGPLLLLYAGYVVLTLRASNATEEMPAPLHLMRWHARPQPPAAVIVVQLVLALAGLIVGAKLFVDALDQTSASLHVNTLILAIVLIPFATELPETLNSVLWIRTDDDSLAFGNVAGSAAFQACILGFIGLEFTPWSPGGSGALSIGLTLATAAYLMLLLGRRGRGRGSLLLLAGLPWAAFVITEFVTGGHIG